MMKSFPLAAATAALALWHAPAAAIPLPGTGVEAGFEARLLSDYRFRGVSRSDEDPAVQASLVLSGDSGFYAGARATTLSGLDGFRLRDPSFADLGDVEIDAFAGYGANLGGGFSLDAGLLYYAFAGGQGATDYFEPYASLSYLIGPVETTVGAKYAWDQAAIGSEDMLYLFGQVDAGIPLTPLRLTAQAGRQDWGAYGSYWTWSAGGRYVIGPAEIGLSYVDTDLPPVAGQDAGIVASVGVRF